jgi:PAS domain S-box-containing protein
VGPPDSVFGFPYLIVPFLLWAALRFDVRVVSSVSLVTALVAIGYTDAGRGPFIVAEQTTAEQVLSLQVFLAVVCLLPLIVHALAAGQRRSRDALRESEQRYRTLVETTPDWVWEVDRHLRFTYSSPRVREILGYTSEQMIGRSVHDTLAPTEAERLEAEIATGAEPFRRIEARERVQRHRDGHEVITETSALPVFDADGKFAGYRGVDRDITERKRAEVEAARHREELLEADKLISLGTLVSGVAHEINNPNHFIALNLPVLRRAWEDALPVLDRHAEGDPDFRLANIPYAEMREEIPELLGDLVGGSDRIKAIVSELRNYSRREAGDEGGRVDVNEVVRASLTLLANPIGKATRRFSVEYGVGLPAARGDLRRLEQVAINLILNACQALESPEQAVTVRTRHDAGRGCLVIEVSDEGVGIEPADLAHIRDPFYTTKRGHGGTGLGLAVASRIVEEHGGRLEYDSRVGVGTTARLFVPEYREERS